jgi:hypothetical protein
MKTLFEKAEYEERKAMESRNTFNPKTPDGKTMRAFFEDELEKKEKEVNIPQGVVTPGVKAMKSIFDPEEVQNQKEFDGRNTFCPKTPDIKVILNNK